MKRFLILIFSLVMFAAAVSCSQPTNESFDLDFVSMLDTSGTDLEGMKVKYLFDTTINWATAAAPDTYLGYSFDTTLADAAMKRVSDIENEMNFKLDIENRTGVFEYVKAPIMSGVYVADIASSISDMWGDYCQLGLFVGMSKVSDYIDVNDTEKWGQLAFNESMFYKDDLYGVVPALWPELTHINFGYPIVFNGNILASRGLTDPREYVENKQWTWDKFEETVAAAHVEEGGTVKHYGFIGAERMIAEMYIFSNGSNIISKQDDGSYAFGLYDYRGQAAMEACNRFINDTCKNYIAKHGLGYNHDKIAQCFASEEAVMAAVYTGYIYGRDAIVSQEVYDFGILSWPHGPDVEPGFTFGVVENIYTAMVIPVTAKSPETSAMIMNSLYEPLEGFETKESIQEYMTYNYFFDKRDAEVFFKMHDNCVYNWFHWFDGSGIVDFIGRKNVSEHIQSKETSLIKIFDDEVRPILDGILAVYGDYSYSMIPSEK